MNEHTDYKSELAITQELLNQYDSNLRRIIKEFSAIGSSNISCYEDIHPVKTGAEFASGTSSVTINSKGAYFTIPYLGFSPNVIVAVGYIKGTTITRGYFNGTTISSQYIFTDGGDFSSVGSQALGLDSRVSMGGTIHFTRISSDSSRNEYQQRQLRNLTSIRWYAWRG